MIEVVIDSVRASLVTPQKMILLRETAQDRYLPIFIGTCEAEAIVIELLNQRVPRPLTHDLLKSVIGALEGRVSHVLVSELRNDIFFAKIIIDLNGEKIEVDSRPSDAMALAVRTKSSVLWPNPSWTRPALVLKKTSWEK